MLVRFWFQNIGTDTGTATWHFVYGSFANGGNLSGGSLTDVAADTASSMPQGQLLEKTVKSGGVDLPIAVTPGSFLFFQIYCAGNLGNNVNFVGISFERKS